MNDADTRAAELALCARCASGDAAAIAEIEARYFPEIDRALVTLDREGDLVAEIRQRVRLRLFVGPEPAIARFAGKGPLGR